MSDEENPASSSSPSTGQPTPPLAASGQQAGFADILQRNVIWAAFILVVAVVTATAAVFLFFEDRVKKQVAELVPQKVYEIYQSDQWGIRLHAAENEAIVSHDRAIAAQTNAQNSSANAEKMAGDAKRNADELQSRVTQLTALIDISKINTKLDDLLSQPKFREEVIRRILPSGAVVAFDISQGCPKTGWSAFNPAAGRTIVGAGPNSNIDQLGRTLSRYDIGAIGGEEHHLLSIDELPAHSHRVYRHAAGETQVGNPGAGWVPGAGSVDTTTFVKDNWQTGLTGGGQPFNVKSPYVALYYCKKD